MYYVPKYLQYDVLTNQTWRCNEEFWIPARTNTFAKLIHSMYVSMHGMYWVSAVPFLCMCMWWLCRRLCSSVVLGTFWEDAWVDVGCSCGAVCVRECVHVWVHLCHTLSQCLWITFATYKCPNIDVLDGGEEHTSLRLSAWDGCVRPGTAPHALLIVTLDPISLAMEPLISHILMSDGSAGKRMCKLNLLWALLFCRHASICSMKRVDLYVCSHAHVFILLSPQWKGSQHAKFFCHREKLPLEVGVVILLFE